jgi:DNA (cytosine-5)-methyltransferase 1
LEAAGMTTVFQCEIDKHARSVLDYHWPDVPKWDDVSTLTGAHILEVTGGVDVVAWGSPCQDLSLAGKRAGLSGERSGLFHQGIRIIKELRELSNGTSPTWSVWENVVGALSSNGGSDFGEVLHEMDEAGACFSEWTVLDAQYFGVPQRRRRVFVTSCFDSATSERCGSPLFPVCESVSGDSAKGGKKKQGVARETADCVGTSSSEGFRLVSFGEYNDDGTASALKQRDYKDATDLIVEPILLDGRRVDDVRVYSEPVQTLQERMGTGGNNVPVVAQDTILLRNREGKPGGGKGPLISEDISLTLGTSNDQTLFQTTLSFDTQFGSNANVFEDQAPTLKASQQPPSVTQQEVGYTATSFAKYVEGVGTLKAHGGDLGGGSETIIISEQTQAISYDGYNQTIEEEIHRSWRIGRDLSDFIADLREPTLIVRRLTPLECERLMGWPDNHTAQGTNGAVSDTNRYKMCGNGIASPVAQWIAKHILATHPDAN